MAKNTSCSPDDVRWRSEGSRSRPVMSLVGQRPSLSKRHSATQILPRNAQEWREQSEKVGRLKPNGGGLLAINAYRLHREGRGWALGSDPEADLVTVR